VYSEAGFRFLWDWLSQMKLASQTTVRQCLLWRSDPSEVLLYLMSKANAFIYCEMIRCDANRETSLKGVEGRSFSQRVLLFCAQLCAQVKIIIKKLM